MACGSVLMPTPSSRMVSACSKSSHAMPRARNISAVVNPPIPPPTIIAFIAFNSTQPTISQRLASLRKGRGRGSRSSLPSGLFGRKRLCGLRLQLGAGLRLSLNFKLLEILPVSLAVAENLVPARQILRRAEHLTGPVPGGSLQRKRRVNQMRAPERNQIGPAGGKNGINLVGRGDVADTHGRHACFVADLIGERGLEHAAIDRLRVAHGLPGGDIDEVDASF